jgi:hypothetical protein
MIVYCAIAPSARSLANTQLVSRASMCITPTAMTDSITPWAFACAERSEWTAASNTIATFLPPKVASAIVAVRTEITAANRRMKCTLADRIAQYR